MKLSCGPTYCPEGTRCLADGRCVECTGENFDCGANTPCINGKCERNFDKACSYYKGLVCNEVKNLISCASDYLDVGDVCSDGEPAPYCIISYTYLAEDGSKQTGGTTYTICTGS